MWPRRWRPTRRVWSSLKAQEHTVCCQADHREDAKGLHGKVENHGRVIREPQLVSDETGQVHTGDLDRVVGCDETPGEPGAEKREVVRVRLS